MPGRPSGSVSPVNYYLGVQDVHFITFSACDFMKSHRSLDLTKPLDSGLSMYAEIFCRWGRGRFFFL